MSKHYNVLFLCSGNSARSIFAEAILNLKGRANFTGYSAGSHPAGFVHILALKQLTQAHIPVVNLRSKSWDEFASPDAPRMDFVFTVCDTTAKEICPVWPGQPMTAHWGVPDPAKVTGELEVIDRAFRDAFVLLDRRISLFISLPLDSLEKFAIQNELDRIGRMWGFEGSPTAPLERRGLTDEGNWPSWLS
jgi:arsenate reductase